LQSVLKQAMVQATGPVLLAEFLPPELRAESATSEVAPADGEQKCNLLAQIKERLHAGSRMLYAETLESMERTLLTVVLTHTEGNQSKAAEVLGITRGSLRNKIRLLGINIERKVNLEENGAVEPEASEV
jgi:two-component system nitrogen regulation response regulator GlnG